MDTLKTALVLDFLDDDTARFTGADKVEIERRGIFGEPVIFAGNLPLVILSRDVWIDMGCPTVLALTLSEVMADDRSAL